MASSSTPLGPPPSPSKSHPHYSKDSQNRLRVLKRKENEITQGILFTENIKDVLEKFCSTRIMKYEQAIVHQWELNRKYHMANKNRGVFKGVQMSWEEYFREWAKLSEEVCNIAQQVLETRSCSSFVEEEIRTKLTLQIKSGKNAHDISFEKVMEAMLADATFTGSSILRPIKPHARVHKEFRESIISRYNLRQYANTRPARGSVAPPQLNRSDYDTEEHFSQAQAQEAEENKDKIPYLMCQVSGNWYQEVPDQSASSKDSNPYVIVAAHIVPHRLAGMEMNALIGIDESCVDSWKNGILMLRSLEHRFDKGQFVLVPTSLEDPTAWKVVLISQDVIESKQRYDNMDTPNTVVSLDGNSILFGDSDCRPSRTCLYFRYVMAWLRTSQEGKEAITKAHKLQGIRFITPTPAANASVLASFATQIGDKQAWEAMKACQPEGTLKEPQQATSAPSSDAEIVELELIGAKLAKMWRAFTTKVPPPMMEEGQIDEDLESLDIEDDGDNESS